MNPQRHRAIWLRMLAVKEIRMKRDVMQLFKAQARRFVAAYKKGGHIDAESAVIASESDWYKVLIPNYSVTIRDFSIYLREQLLGSDKSIKANFTDMTMGFIERQATAGAKNLTQTTKNQVTSVILSGEKAGLGVEDIAQNITNTVAGADIAIGRAATIARTETHSAAGYAMQVQASDVGFPVTKTWVAVEDERTRQSHIDMDGTEIGNDEYFELGFMSKLLYPGDPDGDPGEIINCRCTLVYSPSGTNFEDATYE